MLGGPLKTWRELKELESNLNFYLVVKVDVWSVPQIEYLLHHMRMKGPLQSDHLILPEEGIYLNILHSEEISGFKCPVIFL